MTDLKISALTELATAPANNDELVIVDKSDTTMAASGTTKRIQTTTFKTPLLLTDGSHTADKIVFTGSTELTIATGVITATQSYHRVDTQADAASDDLDTINGGSDGMALYLVAESDARTVVIKHGTGNIVTPDGNDFSLDTDDKAVHLVYSSAISAWRMVGGGGSGAPATATYITQTASAGLSAEQSLGNLGTGLLKNTSDGTTGTLSIASTPDLPLHRHATPVAVAVFNSINTILMAQVFS